MSDKYYTAEKCDDGYILVHLPRTEYLVTQEEARKLRDSIDAALSPAFTFADADLHQIMPMLSKAKCDLYFPFLFDAMAEFEINTPLRAAAFLSQLAHESGELKWMEEIWGPTPAQKRYEGREDLGNTEPGDGYRFRGRGPIQITGRRNYQIFGELLGVDLESDPDLASKPEFAFQIAGAYWTQNGCNELADFGRFKAITRAINGGLTNLADRQKYYDRALVALGIKKEGQ